VNRPLSFSGALALVLATATAPLVRAYDNGVALRYEIPTQPGLETYIATDELTEFVFPSDFKCWAGNPSACAENQYPEKRLSQLSAKADAPHVLPLLVKLSDGYAAIAESDCSTGPVCSSQPPGPGDLALAPAGGFAAVLTRTNN
jgi:hypothetical protein